MTLGLSIGDRFFSRCAQSTGGMKQAIDYVRLDWPVHRSTLYIVSLKCTYISRRSSSFRVSRLVWSVDLTPRLGTETAAV
jgi:ribosomal protein L44E